MLDVQPGAGGGAPNGSIPAVESTISHGPTSPWASEMPIAFGPRSPRPAWVMITSVSSAGRFLLIVKRVWPSLCATPPLIAVPPAPPFLAWSPGVAVGHGCLQALPGGRYCTTARMPASRSLRSSPAASLRELISTVTVPSSFLVTAYAGEAPPVRNGTPAPAATASRAAMPPASASLRSEGAPIRFRGCSLRAVVVVATMLRSSLSSRSSKPPHVR